MECVIFPSSDDLVVAVAALVSEEIATHGELLLGLAGGSTPRNIHGLLSGMEIEWGGVTAWMTDERWVSPDDPESNQGMVRDSLRASTHDSLRASTHDSLRASTHDSLRAQERVVFIAPDTTLSSPDEAARLMTRSLVEIKTESPSRSLTMLGVGEDGHTASLFPGTDALNVTGSSYISNWVPHLDVWRLTASVELLSDSDVVVFVVSGEAKAEVVARIAAGGDYPAGRISARQRVLWMLDSDAASLLKS